MPKMTILGYLAQNAKGPGSAKTAAAIKEATGIGPVELRSIVNTLRCEGYPIGSGSTGYFYARSFREIRRTIDHLNRRATRITLAADGLERAFLVNRRDA